MTGTEILRESFEDTGIVNIGGTIAASDSAAAFRRLCQIIGHWHMQGIEIPHVLWASLALAAGDDEYTIGEDGTPDLDTIRPEHIRGAFVRDGEGTDNQLRPMKEAPFRRLASKAMSGQPKAFWYHDTYPNGTLYVWPVPSAVETLHIFYTAPMTEPATAATEVLVPRGYDLALIHELSLQLMPRYGREPQQIHYRLAKEAKKACISMCAKKKLNPPRLYVTSVGATYSIIEGGAGPDALLLE